MIALPVIHQIWWTQDLRVHFDSWSKVPGRPYIPCTFWVFNWVPCICFWVVRGDVKHDIELKFYRDPPFFLKFTECLLPVACFFSLLGAPNQGDFGIFIKGSTLRAKRFRRHRRQTSAEGGAFAPILPWFVTLKLLSKHEGGKFRISNWWFHLSIFCGGPWLTGWIAVRKLVIKWWWHWKIWCIHRLNT